MAAQLFGTSHGSRIWLSLNCGGLMMASITWFLVIFACSVMSRMIYAWHGDTNTGLLLEGILFSLGGLALLSHARAMLTDPGAIPSGATPLPDREHEERTTDPDKPYRSWCRVCKNYKPPRAHHDSCTGRCVCKMDHFCPWVNNCVGVANHKLFLLFVFYIFLLSVFTLGCITFRAGACVNEKAAAKAGAAEAFASTPPPPRRRRRRSPNDSYIINVMESMADSAGCSMGVPVVLVVLEGLLFMLFTMAMLCDQASVVQTGVAGIDRRKGATQSDLHGRCHEIFGGPHKFQWHWLWPSPADFGTHKESIMGFVAPRDDGRDV